MHVSERTAFYERETTRHEELSVIATQSRWPAAQSPQHYGNRDRNNFPLRIGLVRVDNFVTTKSTDLLCATTLHKKSKKVTTKEETILIEKKTCERQHEVLAVRIP